jgi:hypothetical protein
VPGSKIGELAVSFDLVIGVTPEDPTEDRYQTARRRG